MRIVHTTLTFLPKIGGAENIVHNIVLHQNRDNHDVAAVVPWRSWAAIRSLVSYDLFPLAPRSVKLAQRCLSSRIAAWYVSRQFRWHQQRHAFDLWHVHYAYPTGYLVLRGLAGLDVPVVLTSHGADIQQQTDVDYGARSEERIDRELRESIKGFSAVTAVTDSIRRDYLDVGVPDDRVHVIPHGIDTERFGSVEGDKAALLRRHDLPPDTKVILSVGRNTPEKGYDAIPAIVRKLRESRSDFVWLLVGINMQPIADAAARDGNGQLVRAIDPVRPDWRTDRSFSLPTDELIRYYKSADVLVAPSVIESFGCVALEAMAAGLPVVATDVPGFCDLVANGRTGLLSPLGDTESMARDIGSVLSKPGLGAALSSSGLKAASLHAWDRVVDAYLDLYRKILTRNEEQCQR